MTPDHLRHLLLGSMYCYAEVHNHYRRRNDPRDSAALQENKKFATVLRDFAQLLPYEHHRTDTIPLLNKMLVDMR